MAQAVGQDPSPVDDDVVELSPFQVDATKEKGYFAENTLAGSRMRTNISDLGAAISVVTKQQLEDTASLDVNDIFRYEIGTEGSWTYTPTGQTFRNDGVADAIAGNTFGNNMNTTVTNSTANRVRGLGSPSFAINYYTAIAQIPFDSYNAASYEINRGPNSLLFGMGSPAGIVNQTTASALINKDTAQVQVRVDDRSSNRASFNFNKTLIKDKLAVYGALLYDDKQYERKPSYDITRRQYGAITYKPFKRTTIRASVEGYSNDNSRPNSLTPRDGVSEWRAAGQPYYDSQRQQIVSNVTGLDIAPYAANIDSPNASEFQAWMQQRWSAYKPADPLPLNARPYSPTDPRIVQYQYNGVNAFGSALMTTKYFTNGAANPFYVPGIGFQTGRAASLIANGALQEIVQGSQRQRLGFDNFTDYDQGTGVPKPTYGGVYAFDGGYMTYPVFGSVYDNPAWASVYDRSWAESSLWQRGNQDSGQLNALYPTVTDSSIYDWRKINILSMNYAHQRNTNYNIELEQEIIPGLLHLSAGWFRQDFDSMQSYTVAQLNATTLQVDTNKYYPDGRLNPYFGKVYVNDMDPDRYTDSWTTDQYRAMLAFTPDFTKNNGWTKWLGRHQILGLASYMDVERTTMRKRLSYYYGSQMVVDQYMPDTTASAWRIQSATASKRYFYLSDTGDTVTQAVGAGAYNADVVTGPIRLYDYASGQWRDEQVSMIWNNFDSGTTRNARLLTSYSAAWNAYLWDDRIIATLGVRRDMNRTRGVSVTGLSNDDLYEDGVLQLGTYMNRWNDWSRLAGTTTTQGLVVKPFLNWEPISRRAGDSLLWEFVETLGFSYNKSDNFDAPTSTVVDFFGNVLPKPEGEGTDYGVQFSLFKGKLYARINWFKSTNENVATAPGAMQRLHWHVDSTAYRSWLGFIYMLNNGLDPLTNSSWQADAKKYAENANERVESQVNSMQAWVAEKWGLGNWKYYDQLGGSIAGTHAMEAKGTEVTVQYNPMPNWTIKLTASKTETNIGDVVLDELTKWHDLRKAVWDAADAKDLLTGAAKTAYGSGEVMASNGTPIKMGTFWESYGYYDVNANNGAGGMTVQKNTAGYENSDAFYRSVFVPFDYQARSIAGQQVMGQRKYNVSVVTNYAFDRGALKGWSIGGAQRFASKAIVGYYGLSTSANKTYRLKPGASDIYDAASYEQVDLLDAPDVTRPIYDDPQWYTDLWIAYTRKIFNDKVRMKLQLNVADVFQGGELQAVAYDYEGKPMSYRIMDPRTFMLTATFDF